MKICVSSPRLLRNLDGTKPFGQFKAGSASWPRMTGAGLVLLLAACNPLGAPKPADAMYVLHAHAHAPSAQGAPVAQSVKIALPETAPGLESNNIAILEGAHKLNHYTGAVWAAPLPQTVQHLLADAFQRSGRFRAVGTDAEGITTDLTLLTDIADWQVEGGAEPVAHIRATVKITHSANRVPLLTIPFEAKISAQANRTDAIVQAFDDAANQLAEKAIEASYQAAQTPEPDATKTKKR